MNTRAKKRIGVLVALVVVMVLAGATAYVVREQRRAARMESALNEGLAAYAQQDWELTLDRLGYCVGRNIPEAAVYAKFADARRYVPNADGSHIRLATLAAEIARDKDPENRQALSLLMELYASVGFFTELTDTIETVLQLDPTDREALEYAVGVHREQDEMDEALAAAERLVSAYPDDFSAQAIRIVAMMANQEPIDLVDARLDELELAFPNKVSASLMRALVLIDRGEPADAAEIIRSASSSTFTDWSDLEQFANAADALSVEDPELAGLADQTLKKYLDDPDLGADAARLTLARGFRWGSVDESDRCLAVIASSAVAVSDATLGWAAFTHTVNSKPDENSFADQLADRPSDAARWWITACALAKAIETKNTSEARDLLETMVLLATDAEQYEPALAAYLAALIEVESGEWRTAATALSQLGQEFGWRVARQTLARVLLEQGFPGDAHFVLQQYPGSDGLLLAETVIQLGDANPGNAELMQDLATLADELEVAGANEPRLLLPAARAYMAIGQVDDALRLASRALDSLDSLTTQQLLPLAARVAQSDPVAARTLLERVSIEDANAYSYLWNLGGGTQGQHEAVVDSLRSRIALSTGDVKVALQKQLIDVYVRQERSEDAVAAMRQLSDENDGNAQIQLQILGAPTAWLDEDLVEAAIGRLRVSSGTQATQWRIFALRRAIAFNQDPNTVSEAINMLADAIRGKPDDPRALAMLADALVLQDDPAAAATYLSRAFAADSRNPIYLVQLVETLLLAGNIAEADRRLTDLMNVSVLSDDIRRARASLLARRGRRDEAISDLRFLGQNDNPADLHTLGFMLVRQGDINEADAVFDQMLMLNGVSDKAIATVADFRAIRDNDLSKGEQVLERLRDRDSAEVALLKAAFYERHGKTDEAERLFIQAVQAEPGIASPGYAVFLLRQSRFSEASTLCELNAIALKESPEMSFVVQTLEGIGQIAKICEKLGADAEEVSAIVGALGDAKSATTLLKLAGALQELSRTRQTPQAEYGKFINELAAIIDAEPTFYAAWRLRVWAESKDAERDERDPTEALATARSAARTIRDDPRTAGLVVGVLMQSEQWDEAMFAAREWRNRSLADPFDADFTIAAIHIIRREFAEALQVANPWWRDGQGDARITDARLVIVASALIGVGRTDDAHKLLWQPESTGTDWAIRYLQLVEVMGDQPEEARKWFRRIEPVLIETSEGRFATGRRWYEFAIQSGASLDFEEAARILTPLTSDEQLRGAAFSLLGICYDQLELYTEAISAYESALVFLPQQPTLLNNLAYATLRMDGNPDRAVDLATRAIAEAQGWELADRASLHDTLGSALLEAGRPAEALEEFRRAALSPSVGVSVRVGICESLEAMGQLGDARAELAQIQQMLATSTIQDPYIQARYDHLAKAMGN